MVVQRWSMRRFRDGKCGNPAHRQYEPLKAPPQPYKTAFAESGLRAQELIPYSAHSAVQHLELVKSAIEKDSSIFQTVSAGVRKAISSIPRDVEITPSYNFHIAETRQVTAVQLL